MNTPSITRHVATESAVIIGTEQTASGLAAQLAIVGSPIRIIGCITVDRVGAIQLGGQPLLGDLHDLPAAFRTVGFSHAIVSLPAAARPMSLKVRALLHELGVIERVVPPLAEMLAQGGAPTPRTGAADLDVVELIGRMPYGIDRRAVGRILEDKRVLITGAGGSIGSELSRIAATFRPELLILMERSENALFEIDRQIARRFPDVPRRALLHDVVDAEGTRRLLGELRPHAVFHAAAHKHVPLMEDHPSHAVTNNLFGTKSVADAAVAAGAERFVLVSSDKAVNPSSVMGATKRLAEMYVQSLHGASATRCSMVRFGNVLGSACSVLPIWGAQLADGGPVTVTDPRMTRYFMTIHEAATLVIQAAAIESRASAAPVYVLDMGEPVRILDLARRFVRAHGYEPAVRSGGIEGRDIPTEFNLALRTDLPPLGGPAAEGAGPTIDIVFTGIRPGEKLHEELAYAAEGLLPTPHPGIRAWGGTLAAGFDAGAMVADLAAVRDTPDREAVLAAIRRNVPEMSPNTPPLELKNHSKPKQGAVEAGLAA